jgi:carbamoyl-phosphate synthase small subunit
MVVLEDGTHFHGTAFGSLGESTGEMVFNTSMTGYQEILTDPSYKGQIVTMTYPLIGNTGVNREDMESATPKVEGFVVREYCKEFSNWRAEESLGSFLEENGVNGVEGIDTRALTKHIRTAGAMRAIVSTTDLNKTRLIEKVKDAPGLIGRDLVKEVTCPIPYRYDPGPGPDPWLPVSPDDRPPVMNGDQVFSVVALDFGAKRNILKILHRLGCEITVVPATSSAEEILSYHPDGIFLSNGPGDPQGVPYAVDTVRELLGQKPLYGICLGHQILGLAMGGSTFKLKFGHRGANQPVKDLKTGRISITAQNHGFCVDLDSLDESLIQVTHVNLNDRTLEGMIHRRLPVYSVQYHPEASPGPHDARSVFHGFLEAMSRERNA